MEKASGKGAVETRKAWNFHWDYIRSWIWYLNGVGQGTLEQRRFSNSWMNSTLKFFKRFSFRRKNDWHKFLDTSLLRSYKSLAKQKKKKKCIECVYLWIDWKHRGISANCAKEIQKDPSREKNQIPRKEQKTHLNFKSPSSSGIYILNSFDSRIYACYTTRRANICVLWKSKEFRKTRVQLARINKRIISKG